MKQLHGRLSAAPYRNRDGLCLSVSGGMDSMVLLDVFDRMRHVHGAPLKVVHIHHGTGTFADRARDLVRAFCHQRELFFRVIDFRWNGCGNFEYEAAAFRRRTLAAERDAGQGIVLAHHLQDQAETFLQTLIRGAGLATPLGMEPVRDHRLRPFLDVDRDLLEEHARLAAVPYLLDPSNEDGSRFRNAIRHQVMPVLRSFYGHCEQRLGSWMSQWLELRRALEREAAALFEPCFANGLLQRQVFRDSKPYLWDFILKLFWERQDFVKPKDRCHLQLKSWLRDDALGAFDHQGRRIYCDLDGLIAVRLPDPRGYRARFGDVMDWGAHSFRLQLTDRARRRWPRLEERGLRLFPLSATPKHIKDFQRRMALPLRIRQNLPVFEIGNGTYHFHDLICLERSGLLVVEQTGAFDLKAFFTGLEARAHAPELL